jgi:hypothetical protein
MTGDPSSASDLGGYPVHRNWQKSLGDHTVYGTSDVVVNGDQITMKIKVHAEDMYNFNADAADIATARPTTTTDGSRHWAGPRVSIRTASGNAR